MLFVFRVVTCTTTRFGHYQTVRHHEVYVVFVMLLSCRPVCCPYQAMWAAEISNRTQSSLLAVATGLMHFVSDVFNDVFYKVKVKVAL